MNYIYLIGDTTGAARTQSETIARDYEMTEYHKCTQQEYLQRLREMRALDLPPDPTENICPTCSTPMNWEDCDVCGGEGYIPLQCKPGNEMCEMCDGKGGWWICPSRPHTRLTEKDRTASGYASATPASTPAPPLAGCQRPRQRKETL